MRMVLDAQLNDFRALYAKHPSNRGLMRGGKSIKLGQTWWENSWNGGGIGAIQLVLSFY